MPKKPQKPTSLKDRFPALKQKDTNGEKEKFDQTFRKPANRGRLVKVGGAGVKEQGGLIKAGQITGLGRAGGGPNPVLERRLQGKKPSGTSVARMKELQKEGKEYHARKAAEAAEEKLNKVLARLRKDLAIRVAFALDFTASTIQDVQRFGKNVGKLTNALEKEFGNVSTLSVAFRGKANDQYTPEAVVSRENDTHFYGGVENRTYTKGSPLSTGIGAIIDKNFFDTTVRKEDSERKPLQVIISIADDYFSENTETGAWRRTTLPALQKGDVIVVSLLDSDNSFMIERMEETVQSHDKALEPLEENRIVKAADKEGNEEIDVIDFTIRAIRNLANSRLMDKAKARMKRENPLQAKVLLGLGGLEPKRLADELRKSHPKTAMAIIQGGQRGPRRRMLTMDEDEK